MWPREQGRTKRVRCNWESEVQPKEWSVTKWARCNWDATKRVKFDWDSDQESEALNRMTEKTRHDQLSEMWLREWSRDWGNKTKRDWESKLWPRQLGMAEMQPIEWYATEKVRHDQENKAWLRCDLGSEVWLTGVSVLPHSLACDPLAPHSLVCTLLTPIHTSLVPRTSHCCGTYRYDIFWRHPFSENHSNSPEAIKVDTFQKWP